MKILVLSDSHGAVDCLEAAVEREKPDFILHLGDHIRDAQKLQQRYFYIPQAAVVGNCDFGAPGPAQYIDLWDGVRIFACHGHRYNVKQSLLPLYYAAQEQGADVCLFGHTHRALCETEHGILLLNPGACGGRQPRYAVLTIENGKPVGVLRTLAAN